MSVIDVEMKKRHTRETGVKYVLYMVLDGVKKSHSGLISQDLLR
jgi:hypothetical protein